MSRLTLWWWASAGYRAALVRAGLGALLAVALTVGLSAVGQAGRTAIVDQLLGGGDQLRVRPPSLSVGPLDLAGSVLKTRALTDAELAAFAQVDGVAQVWPEAWSRFPVSLSGDALGARMSSDAALLGLPAAAVGEDAAGEWSWAPGQPVPTLAPRSLIAVYNGSFAPSNGLPKVQEWALTGLDFTIVAGRSSFRRGTGATERLDGEVAGVTAYGGELAGIVPIEVIGWLDAQLGVEDPGAYSAAVLVLAPGADAEAVTAAVGADGWSVAPVGGAARQLAVAIRSVELGVGVAGAVLAGAALLMLAQVFGVLLRERRQDVAVLRSLGAGRLELAAGLLGEVGLAAGLSGVAGTAAGLVGAWMAAGAAQARLAEVLGTSLELGVGVPWAVVAVLVVGGPVITVMATLPGVWRVVR